MTGQTWLLIGISALIGVALGAFILTRTNWYRIRKYAVDVKKIFDKYNLQQKMEAVQALGQNPNPVLAKRPLRELISGYQGLIADLEKVRVHAKTREVHSETVALHRESCNLYQMAAAGGFRQKALQDKQRKLQQMERNLSEKMEKLYGPMKKEKK